MIIELNRTKTTDNSGYVVEYFNTKTQQTSIQYEEKRSE